MSKTKVVIVYGGKSVEHEISINSARNIFQYIDRSSFDVYLVGISKEGDWHFMSEVSGDFSNAEVLSLKLNSGAASFSDKNQSIIPDITWNRW